MRTIAYGERRRHAVNTRLGCKAEDLRHIDRNGGYSDHPQQCLADV